MVNLKYLDDECQDGMEVRIYPSLKKLYLNNLPSIEGLLKVERGEMFPCLSELSIDDCPKLGLPCLPSLKKLTVMGCNNELLRGFSHFHLNWLSLNSSEPFTMNENCKDLCRNIKIIVQRGGSDKCKNRGITCFILSEGSRAINACHALRLQILVD
ncbi:hypothetical protein P8452_43730 [Trifolium repens]|nr:hypothetical protein P8452_43730 [Trifolium repens]